MMEVVGVFGGSWYFNKTLLFYQVSSLLAFDERVPLSFVVLKSWVLLQVWFLQKQSILYWRGSHVCENFQSPKIENFKVEHNFEYIFTKGKLTVIK
jgi:hypothetical protein